MMASQETRRISFVILVATTQTGSISEYLNDQLPSTKKTIMLNTTVLLNAVYSKYIYVSSNNIVIIVNIITKIY